MPYRFTRTTTAHGGNHVKRHVIVEGCDGSGKTSLIVRLQQSLGFPIHERASTSKGGPVSNVDEWAINDVYTMEDQPQSIYDRHPIISEIIYAPLARGVEPFGKLNDPHVQDQLRHRAANHAQLVVCMPTWRTVERNAHTFDQMPGVLENLRLIYTAYKRVQHWWPEPIIWWNYQQPDGGFQNLVVDILRHLDGDYDAR